MNILIVDDDDILLDMLEMTLSSHGYSVVIAHDGEEALRIVKEQHIRMVVSDWMMPKMNGVELCRRIRMEALEGYVYFILLTSRSGDAATVEGFDSGADDYIIKPFNPVELLMRIKVGARIQSLETRHVTIFALAKLAESRDPETGQHLERIRDYCRVLANHLMETEEFAEVDREFVEMVYLTSPLHDIGKVGIPDNVLLKPGKLTDEEFDIMKEHTVIGADTLNAALDIYPHIDYLRMARDITLYHHERFNGFGYPHKVAGDEIPLCARIVALADVYDALMSKRVYKDAFSHEEARSILLKDSGTHFDPRVVDAFVAKEQTFLDIRQHYAEMLAVAV